jgi:hypothetical protein
VNVTDLPVMRSVDAGVERLARNVAAHRKGGATEIALPPHGRGTSLMLGARQRLRPDGAYGPMIMGFAGATRTVWVPVGCARKAASVAQ